MRQRIWQVLGVVAVLGLGVAWRGAPAAQAQGQNPDVLGALLVEVRGLRAAMEQMASAGPRIQLATARLQLQEQRINTLMRRIESTRDAMASTQADLATKQERLARFEESLKRPDAPGHDELALMVKMLKQEVASGTLEVQRLQAEEAALMQDLATEQARWTEINQRLEDLDLALTKRLP
jgi:chromosome segregation ATPase